MTHVWKYCILCCCLTIHCCPCCWISAWSLHVRFKHKAHLHLDDFVDPRPVKHVCVLYVYCDVLMFVTLEHKWVSEGSMLSRHFHSVFGPWMEFKWQSRCMARDLFYVCASGSDWVAWKDRMTQQRGNQSIPQTQWSTCTRKHWEQIMPIQSSCFLQCLSCVPAGRKRGTVARMSSQRKLDTVRA